MENKSIVIYKTEDDRIELKISLKKETLWMDQKSIAELFNVNVPAISKHISNILDQQELKSNRTISKMETVQKEGQREIKRNIDVYNLDMIISIGYRVNSRRATQFRIWATNVLRKYLIEGYAINQNRLESDVERYRQLSAQVKTLKKVVENETFTLGQSKELMKIIADYADGLEIIDQVDHQSLEIPKNLTRAKAKKIAYSKSRKEIDKLKTILKTHDLFGVEKDDSFKSAIANIFQTYNKKELYPSLEEKAANLLYLIIKNHPFVDGNKRIGSFMFVRFLDHNGMLYREDNTKLVAENTLVAMALLIAQSDPKNKALMVKLVMNLLK